VNNKIIAIIPLILLLSVLFCGCMGSGGWNAQEWTEQGNKFAKDGLYSEAIDAYNQSLNLDATNPKVWTWRGIAEQHLGLQSDAMNDFDKAISLNSNESAAWQGKASSLIDSEEYKLALKAAERSIAVAGKDDPVENSYLLEGFAYNRLGQYDDALQMYDKAIEIDPKRIDLWEQKAYTLTKQERYPEVLKCYDMMTNIEPDNAELWNKKGEIHLALGQINEANEAFSVAKGLIERN
jgi:tetratricopeptide (TPR) repeat protein